MRKISQIFIGNVLEGPLTDYASFPNTERPHWQKYDLLYTNRILLYGGDNKMLVTPVAINNDFIKQTCELAGWKNVMNVFPESASQSICEDIVNDKVLSKKIISAIKENPKTEIIPYLNSPQFYKLITCLKEKKLKFSTPETTDPKNKFIEEYYHSKRGFRHLWEQAVDKKLPIKITPGFICENKEEAAMAAHWFRNRKIDFVIKCNRGVQGIGVHMIDYKNSNYSDDDFEHDINKIFKNDYWDDSSIIVEEKIEVDKNKFGGSPSVEIRITKDGKVKEEYPCEQILAEDGKTFLGVGINPALHNSKHIRVAFKALKQIGKYLAKFGYRGYMDMDLVISKDDKVYAVESNLRRTGGTHINEIAKTILGPRYSRRYHLLATDLELNKRKKFNFEKINKLMADVLFDPVNKKGVIFVNADMLEVDNLFVLVVGRSFGEITEVINKLKKLI